MSEYDERGRSGGAPEPHAPEHPEEPGTGEVQHPPAQHPAQGGPPSYFPAPSYGYAYGQQQNPYPQQTAPSYYGQPQPARRQTTAKVPGWIWPLVAATALLVGLLGGILGGVAVSSSLGGVSGSSFETVTPDVGAVPAPLDPENGSVAAVADRLLPSTVQIVARQGDENETRGATGSGFVLDRTGHVITNNHVVAGAADDGEIEVIDSGGRVRSAAIVGRSPVYDIAVLEVQDARRLRPASIGSSSSMNVGETVVAIGSPLGLSSTVTAGIVSALDRPVTTGDQDGSSYINAVQTDAAINPGNSGGPLVNLRGQVVGVNSAIATTGGFGGGSGNIGVGFAIPMDQVKLTATQILRTGEAKYPVIGASVITNGTGTDGAEVRRVPSGSPAEEAGLKRGDVVIAVNDVAVTDGIALIVAIRSHQPGETITLEVDRNGRDVSVRVRLDAEVG
ncbi:MAG: trypsin-like peptidase domain-containing protein [Actinomycetota bacterium]|nr:trypsin-like peptidase domain-containing protein [Actinomycetota bacterium]